VAGFRGDNYDPDRPTPKLDLEATVARTAGPPTAALGRFGELLEPGDEIVTVFWGLAGWSMNQWLAATQTLAVLALLPWVFSGLRGLQNADLAFCGAGFFVGSSFWIRPVLVIAITRRRQLLCCRISRPFQRTTVSQAPVEAARLADFRSGWLYSRLRYAGPGTGAKTITLNIPAACRQAAQTAAEGTTPGLITS
jgi:hypothetical protein